MPAQSSATFKEFFEATRERPVYVVLGVQGSGTNLLGRLLVRIFGFSVLRDRSMVFNAAARLGRSPGRDQVAREIEDFRARVAPSAVARKLGKRFIRRNVPFDGILRELQPSTVGSGSDFARLIYAYRAFSLGAREMAIKSDDIWEHVDAIDAVLPNRRIILLTRDFRDNLLSVGGKRFGPVEPLCAAQYVKRRFAAYDAEYRRAGAHGYHVRFETLVESPRRFVDEFAARFGLDPAVDPDAVLSKFRIRSNKVAKWKRLDPQTLAWCEGLLEPELRAYGYAPASPAVAPPPRGALLGASARDFVKRVPQKLRRIAMRLKD